MDSEPLVSIIIPVFNRAHLIGETLDSIVKQTYKNWECIIVDDSSTDNTKEIVGKYILKDSRFQYYERPFKKNKGANSCRNYGFEISKGQYINWFDSDDLMVESKLASQIAALINSDYSFAVCQTLVFENTVENVIGLRKSKIYSDDFFNDFITNDIKWLTQAPIFRKSFLDNSGVVFDESLHQSQERDFFIKILNLVDGYIFDDTPLVLFRKHNQSISHDCFKVEKLDSNFRVNFNILKNYKGKLSERSIAVLKKSLKTNLKLSLVIKDKNLTSKLKKMINEKDANLSFIEKIKIDFGIVCMKFFKKGNYFFK